jgi:hypothetical protein
MDCHSLLMCTYLLGSPVDPDEFRYGQLLALVTGLSLLLVSQLVIRLLVAGL